MDIQLVTRGPHAARQVVLMRYAVTFVNCVYRIKITQ